MVLFNQYPVDKLPIGMKLKGSVIAQLQFEVASLVVRDQHVRHYASMTSTRILD